MKKTLSIFLFLLSQVCFSQNLVNNWSFEDTTLCPTAGSQISNSIGWNSYRQSPDYFNSCNNTFISVPVNFAGFQFAEDGNAYAGIISYYTPVSNLREFIGTQLNQSLNIGQRYYVSFYVALSYSPQVRFGIGINKIGMRASTVPYSNVNPAPINNYAQVFTDSIVTDTLNWTKVSGSFIADSAYNYFSIGNFFNDSLTSAIVLDTTAWYSYFFVDAIKFSPDSNFVNSISVNNPINSVSVYPNPTNDWIEIRGLNIKSLILYDVLGRMVYLSETSSFSSNKINLSFLPNGVYLLYVKTKKNSTLKKIFKQ